MVAVISLYDAYFCNIYHQSSCTQPGLCDVGSFPQIDDWQQNSSQHHVPVEPYIRFLTLIEEATIEQETLTMSAYKLLSLNPQTHSAANNALRDSWVSILPLNNINGALLPRRKQTRIILIGGVIQRYPC